MMLDGKNCGLRLFLTHFMPGDTIYIVVRLCADRDWVQRLFFIKIVHLIYIYIYIYINARKFVHIY